MFLRQVSAIALLLLVVEAACCQTPPTDLHGDPLPAGAIARIGTVRWRSEHAPELLAFAPDGKTLASASASGICLWDLRTGGVTQCTSEPQPDLRLLTFTPAGRELVIVRKDRVQWRDASTGAFCGELTGQWDSYRGSCSTADGRMLAVSAFDGDVRIWNAVSRTLRGSVHEWGSQNQLALSPDGKIIAGYEGFFDSLLRLWDTTTLELIASLKAEKLHAFALGFRGRQLVIALSFADRLEFRNLPSFALCSPPTACDKPITRCALVSSDGRWFVGLTTEGGIQVWDFQNGTLMPTQVNPYQRFHCLAISPDGKSLAAASGADLFLLDPATGKDLRVPAVLNDGAGPFVFSSDGRTLATIDGLMSVRRWQTATGAELPARPESKVADTAERETREVFAMTQAIMASDAHPSPPWERDVRGATHYHLEGGLGIYQFRSASGFPCVSNGQILAKADAPAWAGPGLGLGPNPRLAESLVSIWDVATRRLIRRIACNRQLVFGLALSRNGEFLAIAARPGPIHICDLKNGSRRFLTDSANASGRDEAIARLLATGTWTKLAFWQEIDEWSLELLDYPVTSMALSADGRLLACALPAGIYLWDLSHMKRRLIRFESELIPVQPLLAFSPDGRYLAAEVDPSGITLWETSTLHPAARIVHSCEGANSLVFSADGRMLATGHPNHSVLIWDLTLGHRQPDGSLLRKELTDDELQEHWSKLRSTSAEAAYRSRWALAAAGGRAVVFLANRLQPVTADREEIPRLLDDLDHELFARRQAACRRLRALDRAAEPQLRAALRKPASLETRKRISDLLECLDSVPAETLRTLRGVAVLEAIGLPAASETLRRLASGHADAVVTQEARAALERLERAAAK
jgi:WD40 repeat protein